jgi:hypothetical protein
MTRPTIILLVTGLFLQAGCKSITSRLLERDPMNTSWSQPRHLNGIPITLKVPTHVKLYVFDVHFVQVIDLGGGKQEVVPVELDVPIRDFASEFIYTEKIFTVDFKRPAGGSANLRLDISDDQYIKEIQHDITDTTIQNITDQLAQLLPGGTLFPAQAKPKTPTGATASLAANQVSPSSVKSLVAVGVFEVDAPDFEQRIREFLDCHINQAHDAWVVPADINGQRNLKRVGGISGTVSPAFCPEGNCIQETPTNRPGF